MKRNYLESTVKLDHVYSELEFWQYQKKKYKTPREEDVTPYLTCF